MSRRSQRLSDVIRRRNDAVECITITDSEDDDVPLPRPQPHNDSSSSDIEYLSPPQFELVPKPKKKRGRPPGSRARSNSQPIPTTSSAQQDGYPCSAKRVYNSQPTGDDKDHSNAESRAKNISSPESNYSTSEEGNGGEDDRDSESGTSSSGSGIEIRPPRRVHAPIDDASLSPTPAPIENGTESAQNALPADTDEPMDCDETAKSSEKHDVSPPPRHLPNKENKESKDEFLNRARTRRLALDRILGCIKLEEGPQFVVQWRGLDQLERVPLDHLRVIAPQQVLEYMIARIRWNNSDK